MISKNRRYFAMKLAELMNSRSPRITQKDLSKILGVTQSLVSDYLNEKKYPGIEVFSKLKDYFRISLFELTGIESFKNIEGDKPEPEEISDDEKSLLEAYRNLDDDNWLKKAIEEKLLEGGKE